MILVFELGRSNNVFAHHSSMNRATVGDFDGALPLFFCETIAVQLDLSNKNIDKTLDSATFPPMLKHGIIDNHYFKRAD